VDAADSGYARHRTVVRAFRNHPFARNLEDAVVIDRIRRCGFVGADLCPVEDPIRRDQNDLATGLVGGVDQMVGGLDVEPPG
jgi:hypothetical protein